ncbi:trypsin delta-like [Thrips palmi]|uniref:Trypsin delta-like n=1 Tax=Thrips palmi TaxID=161013 RepID=A0A6P8Z150_THRPL|nr:trypsin delta-like [Thrips palmi]
MAPAAFASLLATLWCTAMVSAGGSNLFLTPRRSSSSFLGINIGEMKIVGGSASTILAHPYMVSVEEYYTFAPKWFHKCGGTILNHYNILSAAHCIQETERVTPPMDSSFGARSIGGVTRWVPSGSRTTACTAWQSLAFEYPHRLRQTTVSVVDAATCAKDYKGTRAVTKRMICAANPGKDSCTGDSGGPLLSVQRGRADVQYGIVSWGDVCAEAKHPGVYTNLADADIRAYIAATVKRK